MEEGGEVEKVERKKNLDSIDKNLFLVDTSVDWERTQLTLVSTKNRVPFKISVPPKNFFLKFKIQKNKFSTH